MTQPHSENTVRVSMNFFEKRFKTQKKISVPQTNYKMALFLLQRILYGRIFLFPSRHSYRLLPLSLTCTTTVFAFFLLLMLLFFFVISKHIEMYVLNTGLSMTQLYQNKENCIPLMFCLWNDTVSH